MLDNVRLFLSETLWRMDISTQPWWKRQLLRPLRFALLTLRAYLRDGTLLHASALTYITMLAIIPVLTLGLTSLKAFGAGEVAEAKILENIEIMVSRIQSADAEVAPEPRRDETPTSAEATPDPAEALPPPAPAPNTDAAQAADALRNICQSAFTQINSINFAKIGTVGAVALIFMVISVLGRIESSFNAIWGIAKDRPIWRKFTDYLSVIIVAPLLVLTATSLPVLEGLTQHIPNLWGIGTVINSLGIINNLVPVLGGTILFAFLFGFLPNTRVKISSSFLGALFTTLALMFFFRLCMILQIGIGNNSRLYGSLVALPILLFWIYASWQIILIGAEICYVHQHRAELLRESAFTHPSERDLIVLALALVFWAAKCVDEDKGALATDHFANTFALPERDVLKVASILERNHILLPIFDTGSTVPSGYVLSRCATRLTVADVINACLDDTPGEAVLGRAQGLLHHELLTRIDRRFTEVLAGQFSTPIAEVLRPKEREV